MGRDGETFPPSLLSLLSEWKYFESQCVTINLDRRKWGHFPEQNEFGHKLVCQPYPLLGKN